MVCAPRSSGTVERIGLCNSALEFHTDPEPTDDQMRARWANARDGQRRHVPLDAAHPASPCLRVLVDRRSAGSPACVLPIVPAAGLKVRWWVRAA